MTAALKTSITSDASAWSVQGPTEGVQDIGGVSTTEKSQDLSAYAGRYVHIYCENVDVYIAFTDDATNTIRTTSATTPVALVPTRVDQGGAGVHVVVPKGATQLKYAAVTGAGGNLRVVPS